MQGKRQQNTIDAISGYKRSASDG